MTNPYESPHSEPSSPGAMPLSSWLMLAGGGLAVGVVGFGLGAKLGGETPYQAHFTGAAVLCLSLVLMSFGLAIIVRTNEAERSKQDNRAAIDQEEDRA